MVESRTEKRILGLIIGLYILLGVTYAITTPVFEASDELWHYPMIRHLADGNPLPVQVFDPARAGPWKQEASQPPLYYYLGAAVTFWIDTADMEQVRRQNPHVDNGVITVDGNNNLVVHDPAADLWQGTILAVRIVRLLSVLLGAAMVYFTFRIASFVQPRRAEIALGATAVTAFTPMFLFISGAVNNDNLIIPLAALALFLMIRMVRFSDRLSVNGNRSSVNGNQSSVNGNQSSVNGKLITGHLSPITDYCLLGVVIGLAALTKISGVALLALAWGTIFVTRWQASDGVVTWGKIGRWLVEATLRWLVVAALVLLIAGWWYWRNVQLYGDWKGWNAFIAVLGQRGHPASLSQLWGERWGFMMSYWGLFGGVNVPMAMWIYRVLNGVVVAGVFGFVIFAVQEIGDWRLEIGSWLPNLQPLISNLLKLVERHFALVVCFLWSAAVVAGLIQWATTTWSSQGRLVFSALPALNTLLVVGLVGWLPQRPAQWIVTALVGFLLLVAAAAPLVWIQPAYRPDAYSPPRPAVLRPARAEFGDKLRLAGYAIQPPAPDASMLQPGDPVDVVLQWQVLAPMARDWSVFVHLSDPVLERPIAQRDMYPRQGLRPTSRLEPGTTFTDYYRLWVPETAVSPAQLELVVGLYDFETGERLSLANGGDAATLARVPLISASGAVPNPAAVNFENELELKGFAVHPRHARPGETVELTLYWQAKRPLATDYTVFAQIVDQDTTRWAAHDLGPTPPTSEWAPGETQALTMPLTLAENTPPDTYPLIIGAYQFTGEGGFDRLQQRTEDGRLTDDFLTLTQIRVDE